VLEERLRLMRIEKYGAGGEKLSQAQMPSPLAGPKVAAILSVVESCRRLQVPVRDYFSTILPDFADLPIRCIPDLTPAGWVARHS
jgi:hypothetical protein